MRPLMPPPDTRLAIHELSGRHGLDRAATARLFALAGLEREPPNVASRLAAGIAVVGGLLLGLGVVMWVAANWADWSRAMRFALLEVFVVALFLGALSRPALAHPAARAGAALAGLLAVGGLFAFFGQTYQTGADAWQLFALWAVLTLPLALGARADAVWTAWVVVAMVAVTLWMQTHTGHRWRMAPDDLGVHLTGWCFAALAGAIVAPGFARFTGAGWPAFRTAVVLFACNLGFTGLGGLFSHDVSPQFLAALVALLALAGVMAFVHRCWDLFCVAVAYFAAEVLLLAFLGKLVVEQVHSEIFGLLEFAGVAAGLLAALVHVLMKLSRAHAAREAALAAGTAGAAPEVSP